MDNKAIKTNIIMNIDNEMKISFTIQDNSNKQIVNEKLQKDEYFVLLDDINKEYNGVININFSDLKIEDLGKINMFSNTYLFGETNIKFLNNLLHIVDSETNFSKQSKDTIIILNNIDKNFKSDNKARNSFIYDLLFCLFDNYLKKGIIVKIRLKTNTYEALYGNNLHKITEGHILT